VQVDGALQEPPGRSQISLGGEKEVNRIARAVDGAVEIFPLARNFDVGIIHAPASSHGALAPTEHGGKNRQHLDRPAMNRDVIHENTALLAIISSMWRRLSG